MLAATGRLVTGEVLLLPHPRHGRILGRHSLSVDGPWQGLCIDDFFAISAERSSSVGAPRSEGIITRAKAEYAEQGVPGSDEKDVWGARVFAAIGAQVDSSPATVEEVGTLVSLLRAAELPWISEHLASTLAGSWVSCLLFRRCLMASLSDFFKLSKKAPSGPSGSFLRPLNRKQAALAPFCSSSSHLQQRQCPHEPACVCHRRLLGEGRDL